VEKSKFSAFFRNFCGENGSFRFWVIGAKQGDSIRGRGYQGVNVLECFSIFPFSPPYYCGMLSCAQLLFWVLYWEQQVYRAR